MVIKTNNTKKHLVNNVCVLRLKNGLVITYLEVTCVGHERVHGDQVDAGHVIQLNTSIDLTKKIPLTIILLRKLFF